MAEGHVGLSLRHDMTSARAFDAAGDVRQSCYASANVGYGQMRLGLLEEAESSLRHALAVASRLGLTLMAGTAAHNLGLTLALLGGLEEARELERRAIALLQGPKVVRILAAAHEYLARIHLMANEIEQSERCAREGVALAERWDDLRAIAEATLSRALVAKGEAREALQWASKAAAILGDGHADAEDSYIRWAYLDALLANGDESKARAEAIAARDKLEAGLTGIDDERTRRTYLTRIPEHVGVLAICDSLGIGSR
jgi:tetratricopeptide (TPR) repeat protein